MSDLTESQRWDMAEKLVEIPTACWSSLVDWAFGGYDPEDEDYEIIRNSAPDVTGATWCAMGSELARLGSCYCGKFRAGLELPCGTTVPEQP